MTRDPRGSTDDSSTDPAPDDSISRDSATDGSTADPAPDDRVDATRGPPGSLPDPDVLRDRPGVDFADRTERAPPGEFRDHDRWDGIAVVAITDGDGRVVLLWNDEDHGLLPHAPVEPGEDFATAARRVAGDQLDLEVELDEVVRVRRTEHHLETDDARRTTTHDVLFRASPAGGPPGTDAPSTDRGCWTAAWTDELPPNPDWDRPEVRDDVRRFVG